MEACVLYDDFAFQILTNAPMGHIIAMLMPPVSMELVVSTVYVTLVTQVMGQPVQVKEQKITIPGCYQLFLIILAVVHSILLITV